MRASSIADTVLNNAIYGRLATIRRDIAERAGRLCSDAQLPCRR
jgi:hypothetical protein